MAVFPCKFFRVETRYPQTDDRIQLGRSYEFTVPSAAPDRRVFVLHLTGMQYFVTSLGAVDTLSFPERNMAVLDQFYRDHRTAISFDFDHPAFGMLRCKFNRPLEIPAGIPGGTGVLPEFQVELVEQP